ncbi:MAG: M67 family metallopeptidase [Anaerolinea sp.]|nr:M67 family metallopeptidase [Anaerolinea sp.]
MSVSSLHLPATFRQQILAHLQACLPEEGCGLIGGCAGQGQQLLPIPNQLHSPTAFQMQAPEMIAALLSFEQNGLELLAIYHSHPTGPLWPSPRDVAAFAYPGVWTLIAAPTSTGWRIRAFQIRSTKIHPGKILWQNESTVRTRFVLL